jgi:hypothetical protein
MDLGPLLAQGRVRQWTITAAGRRALDDAGVVLARDDRTGLLSPFGASSRPLRRPGPVGKLVVAASYQLLSLLVRQLRAEGATVEVHAFQTPWRHRVFDPDRDRWLRIELPAAAVVRVIRMGAAAEEQVTETIVFCLPDFGTVPVRRAREAVRRLGLLPAWASGRPRVVLTIGTTDRDVRGQRAAAWQRETASLITKFGWRPRQIRVLRWQAIGCESAHKQATRRWSGIEKVLDLVGRHPFLTPDQLRALLDIDAHTLRRRMRALVARRWLGRHTMDMTDGPSGQHIPVELLEVTSLGRAVLGGWLALRSGPATRYHGLIGGERGRAGQRRRLLRALAHTLGAHAVFVELVVAARTARARGGSDVLAEWRGAAACERGRCKPDGYGRYVRAGSSYGFFLEYDRGTERAAQYGRKLDAYYDYRDRGRAAHEYEGFPTVLVVTTQPVAEERIAEQAYLAWQRRGVSPLPVLVTTVAHIQAHPEGILGPVWRTAAAAGSAVRHYWLPGGAAHGLFGVGRTATPGVGVNWPVLNGWLAWPSRPGMRRIS